MWVIANGFSDSEMKCERVPRFLFELSAEK